MDKGLGRSGLGPQGYGSLVLFKCLLLDQWHGLSDPKLEWALRFRNALVEAKVYDDVLSEVYRQLESHGLKLRDADAAIIDASKANRAHLKGSQVRMASCVRQREIGLCERQKNVSTNSSVNNAFVWNNVLAP